jgi:tetratricopeptide (TPR) repeat protein
VAGDAADDGDVMLSPDAVHSLAALAQACNRLRGGRSYGELARAARPRSLAAATLSDLFNAKSTPTRETMIAFLEACGLNGDQAQRPWLAALQRVRTGPQPRPAGAVRVRDARPRRLGVHAAIQMPGAVGELPPYVPRDLDVDLRSAISAAVADGGGFVLLVGSSSVGKTRALAGAVQTVVPDWWLIHPDPTDADHLRAVAAGLATRTVVWLDELQRYLDPPTALTAGLVRRLTAAGSVVLGTLWPDEYARRSAPRVSDQPDPHADAREVLNLAAVIDVPHVFSAVEHRRAEALAEDRRIRIALDTPDAGFTQVLAAGPALVRWWETAPNPYGKAIITAALDARRVGFGHTTTAAFLRAAAPGYLTAVQQATAPRMWLEEALAYATTPLHGAASALAAVPSGIGQIAGYTAADYLYQHAVKTRRTVHLPETVWQTIAEQCPSADAFDLAEQAERRGRYHTAEELYRKAIGAGVEDAVDQLADLLAALNRVDEATSLLQAQADGDASAARHLTFLLAGHGRVDDAIALLRQSAAEQPWDWETALRLDRLLAQQHDVEELEQRATGGDGFAIGLFADLLVDQGRVEEAVAVRRRHHRANELSPFYEVAERLAAIGRFDEAVTLLSPHVDGSDDILLNLLGQAGAVEELRRRAQDGSSGAAHRLADMLAAQGNVDEAVAVLRGYGNDWATSDRIARILADVGRLDEAVAALRPHIGDDEPLATATVARLLARQGRVEEAIQLLRPFAERRNSIVDNQLAALLAEQGRLDEAIAISEPNTYFDRAVPVLVESLARQGRLDDAIVILQEQQLYDPSAASRKIDLLTRYGRLDEATAALREEADIGRTITLLAEHDHVEEAVGMLRRLADEGDWSAAEQLVDVLLSRGRLDDLRDEVAAGTPYAGDRMRTADSEPGASPTRTQTA